MTFEDSLNPIALYLIISSCEGSFSFGEGGDDIRVIYGKYADKKVAGHLHCSFLQDPHGINDLKNQ